MLAKNNTPAVAVVVTTAPHRGPGPRASVSEVLPVPPALGSHYPSETCDCEISTHTSTRSTPEVLVKSHPSRIRKPPDRLGFEGEG